VKPNAPAMVIDALKTWPETVALPPYVEKASPVELAECRSRLQQIAQCATELRRLVDVRLAEELGSGALRYGDTVLRQSTKGKAELVDPEQWWLFVASLVTRLAEVDAADLLEALYGKTAPRLGALSHLVQTAETALDETYTWQQIRDTFIDYAAPYSPLAATPLARAPQKYQSLPEGEVSG
jgi:hypothetical protein